ncbi:MAG TPA: hypothetical protein ENL20_05245 [Candidatus Cloacimonetes bacterium]|nr:hypothetical protein [Candidatus Cloacimonadota bacterium]
MKKKNFVTTLFQTAKGVAMTLPILIGIILCLGLFKTFVSVETIHKIFSGNVIFDTLIGSVVGSITAGNPINSYIIGEQLLADGVSLYAIIAFLICWVTVGIVQLPYEISMLGKKFAFTRNFLSFIFSILIAGIGSVIIGVIS